METCLMNYARQARLLDPGPDVRLQTREEVSYVSASFTQEDKSLKAYAFSV